MSDDPRTDFFASGGDTSSADQDARTAFFATGGQSVTAPKSDVRDLLPQNPINSAVQGGFRSLVQGAAAPIVAGVKGLYDVVTGRGSDQAAQDIENTERAVSYQPEDKAHAAGAAAVQSPFDPLTWIPRGLTYAGQKLGSTAESLGAPPSVSAALETAPTAASFLLPAAARGDFSPYVVPAEEGADLSNIGSKQSMGAARTTPQIQDASPELQAAIRRAAQETGGAVNPTALENHLEADWHGVQLTEGQATRDPVQFSAEQNSMHKDIADRLNKQNQQMTDALDNIRREAAPGAVQNNPIENGQIVIDALKAYDEPIRASIDAKYDAARAASTSGDLQMDGSSFVDEANKALKPQSKFRFLPPTVKGILDDVANADGKMTLDDYQAYETQLGNEIAKAKASGDGNAMAAVRAVKSALENIEPIGEESSQAKSLFDTARAAAKARFDELDADPAYRAAIDDRNLSGVKRGEPSALADRFLDKYTLGTAAKANVDRLLSKLDPEAQQAVAAHALNEIRDRAITPNGMVSPNGFNAAMEKYGPKLESLVQPETKESLESLGRVITNAKVPPPGHSVNYSKSGVVMMARGTARGLGEAALNAKTFGLGVPMIKGIAENNFAKRSLAPGAGLTKLPTTPQ